MESSGYKAADQLEPSSGDPICLSVVMIPLSDTRTRRLRLSSQDTLVRCDHLRADRNNHDASNRLGVRGLMPDWVRIEISDFMNFVREDERPSDVVGRIILDRLPYTFDSKKQYFSWRGVLGEGLQVDARDIVIVGSAATGRSLNPRTKSGFGGSVQWHRPLLPLPAPGSAPGS